MHDDGDAVVRQAREHLHAARDAGTLHDLLTTVVKVIDANGASSVMPLAKARAILALASRIKCSGCDHEFQVSIAEGLQAGGGWDLTCPKCGYAWIEVGLLPGRERKPDEVEAIVLRRLLRDIRNHAEEALDTTEERQRDALQAIRDRIDELPPWEDELPPWEDEPGESYEEKWQRQGYRVEWSERQPRAYEIRRMGCLPSDNDCLARLRTVREVDEWIRRCGR